MHTNFISFEEVELLKLKIEMRQTTKLASVVTVLITALRLRGHMLGEFLNIYEKGIDDLEAAKILT